MAGSLNDMRHAKSLLLIGSNPPAAHPVAMQHILEAKEKNRAPIIVVDPRSSRLTAKATDYVRIRPGTDASFMLGLINVITGNGWEDKSFTGAGAAAYRDLLEVVKDCTPEKVELLTGISAQQTRHIAGLLAENRPTGLTWCVGGVQHSIGSTIIRSFHLLQLVLGNTGKPGGGINIFSGQDNAQGAADMCLRTDSLPAYYGLGEEAWRHWCRIWDVDFRWLKSRFHAPDSMQKAGFPLSRRHEGEPGEDTSHQGIPIKALIQWGGGSDSNSWHQSLKKAYDRLDLLVVIDPFPTMAAAACDTDAVYLLPSASQYETSGSVTSTSRQIQWRCKVVDPVHNSKDDYRIMELLVKKLGFAEKFYTNIKQVPEDLTRELSRGSLTLGYDGQTPERIKKQMENWHTFDIDTLRAVGGGCAGECYGTPRQCRTKEQAATRTGWAKSARPDEEVMT